MPQVAVVTGASRGLGAALARELAARGYALGLCATSEPRAANALCRAVDVADADSVDRFAAEVARDLGPLDLWINNAGILGPLGWLKDTDPNDWRRCVAVNLEGVVNGTRTFLAHRAAGQATLVNIASRAGLAPAPGLSAYSATKAAVISLTTAVAEEEGSSGLRAFAVVPPSIDTDMQDTLHSQDEHVLPYVRNARKRKAAGGVIGAEIAAKRILDAVLDVSAPVIVDLT